MLRIQDALFAGLLLICGSDISWAQEDMSGTWDVQLQIDPQFGTGTYASKWEITQQGKKKVSGRIIEAGTGKITKFSDGYRGKTGSLSFKIRTQFEGKPANIVVSVKVKNDTFEGLYDVEVPDEFHENPDNFNVLALMGKLTGRKIADMDPLKENGKAVNEEPEDDLAHLQDEVLFDGQNLEKFRGYKKEEIGKGWKVKEGQLLFDGKTNAGDIITKKQYGSFELTFEWKISAGGNSGVLYRVTHDHKEAYMTGIEYQILDNLKHREGKDRKTSTAAVNGLYPPGDATPNARGKWNSSKIVADEDKVEHWLNGVKVVEAEIGSGQWKEKVAASKFAKWKKFGTSKRGHIAFRNDRKPVWYRNIKIKALNEPSNPASP